MAYTVKYTAESSKDFEKLDGSQKLLVRKSISKIQKYGMQVGEALHGSLAGCRKLKRKKAGLRVVFRESSKGIEVIDIIAIGKRSDSEGDKVAENRLN